MRRPWPLRHRLPAALLGLSAAGLAIFAVAGVVLMDRSLLARVDAQLTEFAGRIGDRPPPVAPPPRPGEMQVPTRFDVAFYGPAGTLLEDRTSGGPDVPAALVIDPPPSPVTVPGADGSWRVLVTPLPDGNRAVVSMSLESNQSTVRQLLVIQLVAGVLVLALLAAIGLAVVRLGLRPLTRMERTAEAIAAGDIDRRVGDSDPHTETGRLGQALNSMLERLARALRERENSEQRLRRFVADASHELRTPLTSIRGFAELYHHGEAERDPAAERLLRRIEGEAERMGVLVEDLLLLARLDQEPALELSTVDLHVLAGDVVHAARARDRDRPVRLTPSDRQARVTGDEHRLHQVLANLVGNAITHTPPGTPVSVTVGHTRTGPPSGVHAGTGPEPGAEAVVVEVADEGPGIDPEHLPHVFDRFYRAAADRSRESGGTGLGLAIAAALVGAHGGRIEVTSSEQGTRFRVLLPSV